MTQIVNPSIGRVANPFLTAGSLAYAGLNEGGIVPSGQQTQLAEQSAADETVLNGFAFSTSGLDVTVSAGEAFFFGSWIIKDTQTTVTLPAPSTTKVYVGWNKNAANSVIIGPLSDFEDEDAKIEVGEFTTDSSTVTSESDLREFVSIDAERLEGNDTEDIKPDVSDNGATVVQNVDDINVEGFSASDDGDGSATIVGNRPYTDSDTISAVDSENSLSVNISGDANTVDGFSFVENGNPASNIINYDSNNENIDIGGQDIANLSIDGQDVQEVTINGSVTWVRAIDATGGTTVIDRTINGVDYRIHAFESVGNSTFSVTQAPAGATVDVLVVGGGGGGGGSPHGAGGGAGGVLERTNYTVTSGNYSVSVGSGGAGSPGSAGSNFENTGNWPDHGQAGENGGNSTFSGLTALGGGGGGMYNQGGGSNDVNGADGGSGGGGTDESSGGTGLQPSSTDGGFGNSAPQAEINNFSAGGGGAGESGSTDGRGHGGDGLYFGDKFTNEFGENGYFGGGGGGAVYDNSSSGTGGSTPGGTGGGGNGGIEVGYGSFGPFGESGMSNTGGGGGGSERDDGASSSKRIDGGNGGSGIVLIRYEI